MAAFYTRWARWARWGLASAHSNAMLLLTVEAPCRRKIRFFNTCFTHAQMVATFHEMGPLEAQGSWLRFWCGGWVG